MRQEIAKIVVEKNNIPFVVEGDGEAVIDHGVYKVRWVQELEGGTKTFELYSNGDWDFDDEVLRGSSSGKTIPPHSRKWFGTLIRKGFPGEFAMAICVEWKELSYKSKEFNR
jgi:hypothetical protein